MRACPIVRSQRSDNYERRRLIEIRLQIDLNLQQIIPFGR
jgi:hypothetical protein